MLADKLRQLQDSPNKEAQMQKWIEFVVNKIMPKIAPYGSISKSIYAFEENDYMPHGHFCDSKLFQTEQLALLGADYALSKG